MRNRDGRIGRRHQRGDNDAVGAGQYPLQHPQTLERGLRNIHGFGRTYMLRGYLVTLRIEWRV